MAHSNVANGTESAFDAVLSSPPPSEPSAPATKYHVLMELGRGGAAVVNAAVALGLGGFRKVVVLKTMRQDLGDSARAADMFLKEARLSARMNHPNVVQVYEVYEDGGLPVIVMEYLAGQSLATFLSRYVKDPAYDVRVPITVLCDALQGLQHAHSLSNFAGRPLDIVHRDVSPQNVMVTYEGQIKLLDFGIAKLNTNPGDTRSGLIKGKLAYMPREQVDGSVIDRRADVYAIGVMLWEAVARRRMWASLTEAAVLKHLLCDEIPDLREVVPTLDADLEAIIRRALAPDRNARYATAEELRLDLERYLAARGGGVPRAQIGQLVSATCADLKFKAQSRLEQELAQFSRDSAQDFSDTSYTLTAHHATDGTIRSSGKWVRVRERPDTGVSTAYTGRNTVVTARERSPFRWLIGAGVAAFVALAALVPVLSRDRPEPNGAAPAPHAAQVPAHSAAPLTLSDAHPPLAPSEVSSSAPAGPAAPAALSPVPRADATRAPRAKAPKASRAVKRSTAPARSARKPARRPKSLPRATSCEPPYLIDAAGIKRYRPECL